ncbi:MULTISPECIES: acyl-CoA dehydrogenase family protein [Actinosynnema]|uniref:acyl-CoA dehydrogenase family protein n=1 Tax=Actinosynnema TaxID=40566 RepID=UPI0020A508A2|nr:acyl-CoA dehydrogenase family protein [Actinosynnema pretiosum]MCP2094949.1 Acyl-CoA dehydrogenase [Actinosynnema pretiosum]
MTTTEARPSTDLVGRAAELAPLIRARVPWQEENRVLHPDVVAALEESGLLAMRLPAAFGGTLPPVREVCDAVAEIGRADGSTSWSLSSWVIGTWMAGLLPDEAQDEIFADPAVRFCGSVGPGGTAEPVEGGYTLTGRWHFNTGARQSQWATHSILLAKDGGHVPALAVVRVSELEVEDDWHTSGMRGTGSVTSVARDVFVPPERVLEMMPVAMRNEHRSARNIGVQAWQVPFLQFAVAVASAPALGMARAAWDAFFERLPGRGIAYTHYADQAQAPLTHLRVAEARLRVDQAEFHLHRAADRLHAKSLTGEAWSAEERALARMDAGLVCERAKEAVDLLADASGGSSIYLDKALQRITRDIQALNLHGIMHPSTNAETYGRVLCGLEPNTDFM